MVRTPPIVVYRSRRRWQPWCPNDHHCPCVRSAGTGVPRSSAGSAWRWAPPCGAAPRSSVGPASPAPRAKARGMMPHATNVALWPFAPPDGPAIAALFEQTSDAGQISCTTRFKADAHTALTALHPDRAGVVAVLSTPGRIVGMALVDFSYRQVDGDVRPCAAQHAQGPPGRPSAGDRMVVGRVAHGGCASALARRR